MRGLNYQLCLFGKSKVRHHTQEKNAQKKSTWALQLNWLAHNDQRCNEEE